MTDTTHRAPGESQYFAVQADIGITKHIGGRKATDELVALCGIERGDLVLEVGCGIGSTTSYVAERYGCRVVGVDLSPAMIARASERARRRHLGAELDFQTADAQDLPFLDDTFDAVIDEFVTAFVPDKQRALSEYARVVRPGGVVGLNEATWITPPPPGVADYAAFVMAGADFQSAEGWRALLEDAGLQHIQMRTYPFDARSQYMEELRQLDVAEYVAAWRRFLSQSLTEPAFRQFAWEILRTPGNIVQFVRCIGHGLYVGRKAGRESI